MEYTLTILILLLYSLHVIQGEIRCYCTEASCVSRGYMCLSEAGRCYSSLKLQGDATHSVHGCIENLTSDVDQKLCLKYNEKIATETKLSDSGIEQADSREEVPMLLCCGEDMCNYREKFDINIVFATGSIAKAPKQEVKAPASVNTIYHSETDNVRIEEKNLWFKAAVIAVPIAGGFILILLVLLAVKMLKSDSKRHRRSLHLRNERSLAKAKLYVKDHFVNRTCEHSYCSPIFCDRLVPTHNVIPNKATSLKGDPSGKAIQKTVDKDGNVYHSICENFTNSSSNQKTCLIPGKFSQTNQPSCNRTTPSSSVIVSIGQHSKCEPAAVV